MRQTKDSNIPWIGIIPYDWALIKGKYLFAQKSEKGNSIDLQLLFPTQKYGVIPQSLYEDLTGMNAVKLKESVDLESLKTIHKGGFCISLRSFQGGFEYSEYEGVVSPAYQVFYPTRKVVSRYYKYLFKDSSFIEKMNSYTMSLRDGKNIAFEDFGNTIIPVPPLGDQKLIADFLDNKCNEIDALINDLQKQIDTIEQYRRSVITEAITHGLNSVVETKESGIIWMGRIPSHWQIIKTKYLFEIVKRIAGEEGYDVLSVTQQGLKVKDLDDYGGQIAESYAGYQFVYPEDFVMNHMDLLTGWVDYSDKFGVTSPDYRVFRLIDKKANSLDYFKYVFQCCYLDKIYYSLGNGVAGVGRWRLQAHTFKNFRLPVPPLEEQVAIAKYLDDKCSSITQYIDANKQKIAILQDYKKSIIYEYVTGKKEVPA